MTKTVNVEKIKNDINEILAKSMVSYDHRLGMINVLEHILHTSGNYRGFAYLGVNEVPVGELPGIRVNDSGTIEGTPLNERFENIDATRVRYF